MDLVAWFWGFTLWGMDRAALGWTVTGVGVAVGAVLYQGMEQPTPAITWLLGVAALLLVGYGLFVVFTRRKPQINVDAELLRVGQWRTTEQKGFQVELKVSVNWHDPVQLRFTLLLPDGTPIDNEEYHRHYLAGQTSPGYLDNPKVFDPGETGPFRIAFVVSRDFFALDTPPVVGLQLRYASVLSYLGVEGELSLYLRSRETGS